VLRDENPQIEHDLQLIITAFEKGMIKSRDVDSVFVGFRRDLESLRNFPASVVEALDKLPLTHSQESSAEQNLSEPSIPRVVTPEEVTTDASVPSEDTEDDEDWKQKIEDWVQDCVPCEFRKISSLDGDFFSDIGDKWKGALEKVKNNLKSLENLLDKSADLEDFEKICDIGNMLKFHCVPDLKKIAFVMNNFLERIELDVSVDLGIFDSFLTSLLSPIFNEMGASLDLISDLAINPIKCVLGYIQKQIREGPQVTTAALDSVRENAMDIVEQGGERASSLSNNERAGQRISEARESAERALERARERGQRAQQRTQQALDRVGRVLDRAEEELGFLDQFQDYLKEGMDWIEEKKDWLLGLIEEFLDTGLDRWNRRENFARGKQDLLTNIAILKALIEAAKNNSFSCGPEAGSMTEEELRLFFTMYQHPSESLEIVVEDDNIIVRRRPTVSGETSRTTVDGIFVSGGEMDQPRQQLPNIVARRPISTCLKNITQTEADQVYQWIRQLEKTE